MCYLCVEIIKESMTAREIARAVGEMTIPEDHVEELFKVINKHSNPEEVRKEMFDKILKQLEDFAKIDLKVPTK